MRIVRVGHVAPRAPEVGDRRTTAAPSLAGERGAGPPSRWATKARSSASSGSSPGGFDSFGRADEFAGRSRARPSRRREPPRRRCSGARCGARSSANARRPRGRATGRRRTGGRAERAPLAPRRADSVIRRRDPAEDLECDREVVRSELPHGIDVVVLGAPSHAHRTEAAYLAEIRPRAISASAARRSGSATCPSRRAARRRTRPACRPCRDRYTSASRRRSEERARAPLRPPRHGRLSTRRRRRRRRWGGHRRSGR